MPSIFPAVQIGKDAYWDGLFSDNPPVEELIRPRSMGLENIPDEIWLIKINPTARLRIPVKPGEIIDRRNQLEGNISLFQQLGHLVGLDHVDDPTQLMYPTTEVTDFGRGDRHGLALLGRTPCG